MPITPLNSKILVLPLPNESETVGGIFVSASASKPTTRGKVIDVGPDVRDVTQGDIVIFSSEAGVSITSNAKELKIFEIEELLAIETV